MFKRSQIDLLGYLKGSVFGSVFNVREKNEVLVNADDFYFVS